MSSFLFGPTIALTLSSADNRSTPTLPLGKTTFVEVTLQGAAVTIDGLLAATGNVEGMVVCFSNVTSSNLALSFTPQGGSIAAPANQFRISGGTGGTAVQFGAVWLRYSSFTQRWQMIART